jgi:site-specific DNA recombinase
MKPLKAFADNAVKQVGIWIRVSTEDQAQGESPQVHERRARAYAESKGWLVAEVYHLEAVSGKAVMAHPESARMLGDIKRGHITGLIFSKLARLARNTKELLEFSDLFREYNADLISLGESIDTSSPAGRLFYTIIAAMAQWEREEIAGRVAASVPIRAKMGKSLGGAAPFGYKWMDQKLVPEPKEAPVRKLIYELFLEHRRFRTVAVVLNARGYRTRGGKKFAGNTVERLICDPTAKGLRRANYTKSKGNKKSWELKPEKDWVYSEVEGIVPEELWEQCNAILAEREGKRQPVAKKPVHLFAGFCFCECGNKMYVPTKLPKYYCYQCHNKILPVDLEAIYHEQLKSYLFSTDEILTSLEQTDQVLKQKQDQVQVLQKKQNRLRIDMDKIMSLYLEGSISKDGFAIQYKPLEEQAVQIDDQIPVLQGEIDFLRIQLLSSDQILTDAKDIHSRWPEMDKEEKRLIVENTVSRITISKNEVNIELSYLPSSSKNATNARHNVTDS